MRQSLFITFEGGEGSGKTTQINHLSSFLSELGQKVITTREPGGTPEAEAIRDLIVQRGAGDWTPMAEVMLLNAARVMHVEKVIKPALDSDKIVISDRFLDSTVAYQGYGHQMDLGDIRAIQKLVLGDMMPDMTIILDIDPEEGLKRSDRRLAGEKFVLDQQEDRYENMELEFHKRLRNGFLEIAKAEPERCHVIDATQNVDDVTKQIQELVKSKLKAD
ncbi:MAG: dTMP kinase [Alphaproteobacteria bacterium]|nr:dTMP kinase [Alphaproteobacteria bacterium]